MKLCVVKYDYSKIKILGDKEYTNNKKLNKLIEVNDNIIKLFEYNDSITHIKKTKERLIDILFDYMINRNDTKYRYIDIQNEMSNYVRAISAYYDRGNKYFKAKGKKLADEWRNITSWECDNTLEYRFMVGLRDEDVHRSPLNIHVDSNGNCDGTTHRAYILKSDILKWDKLQSWMKDILEKMYDEIDLIALVNMAEESYERIHLHMFIQMLSSNLITSCIDAVDYLSNAIKIVNEQGESGILILDLEHTEEYITPRIIGNGLNIQTRHEIKTYYMEDILGRLKSAKYNKDNKDGIWVIHAKNRDKLSGGGRYNNKANNIKDDILYNLKFIKDMQDVKLTGVIIENVANILKENENKELFDYMFETYSNAWTFFTNNHIKTVEISKPKKG